MVDVNTKFNFFLNINNSSIPNDNRCFLWSVLAHFIKDKIKNPKDVKDYIPYMNMLNISNLKFPVLVDNSLSNSISKFEIDNNLMINIYTLVNDENPKSAIAPIRISNRIKEAYYQVISFYDQQISQKNDSISISLIEDQTLQYIKEVNSQIINLFLYKNHFTYINKFNALFSQQFDKHRNINRSNYCHFCLYHSPSIEKLILHLKYCLSLDKQAQVKLPSSTKEVTIDGIKTTKPNKIKFENISKGVQAPFAVYADFETIQIPLLDESDNNRKFLSKHVPSQFAYYITSTIPDFSYSPIYSIKYYCSY